MTIKFRTYLPADRSSVISLMSAFNQYIQSIDSRQRTDYKNGSTIIRFPVFAPNAVARRFYEKAGYTERLIYVMKELTAR